MAIFCTRCGKPLSENERFCTSCGASVNLQASPQEAPVAQEAVEAYAPRQASLEPQPIQSDTAAPEQQYDPSQTYQPPIYQPPAYQPPPDPTREVVRTGTYFGLIFLFRIPLIGFLACLIMAFAPKNKNIKHYARAQLIWALIGLLFASLIIGALIALGNSLLNALNEAVGGTLGTM